MKFRTSIQQFGSLLVAVSAIMFAALPGGMAFAAPVTLTHVHGLAYSADGKQLLIPSHHGLAVYAGGRWSKAQGPAHDYMGFSATRDALYSSGHPAPGSGLTNPFGLIKSTDGGKTWQKLGLEGESDFHQLASSYGTNAVYVVNGEPNSRMREPGIYYTLADGMRWQRAEASGLRARLNALAVHPSDPRIVAAGTDEGLYLSRNSANSFEPLVPGSRVLAQTFDLDGQHLWFSAHAGKPVLARIALSAGAKPDNRPLPAMTEDAVAYIAQNPIRRQELAIATFRKSVYVSGDQGRTWKQIAKEGVGVE
jgi:photosystem II stability/assembly factor-like uncharacterized protein